MNISTVKGVRMEVIAACVPENKVDNMEFAKSHFEEDMTALIASLGIQTRHVCRNSNTTALDMCVSAAEEIFTKGKVERDSIGCVIFVTQTPDYIVPNNSSAAQAKLKLPDDVMAFDINHACSGYLYGLYVASLISANSQRRVLLLDGDTNSRYSSPWDKGTSLLFGDAGTATVIAPTSDSNEWYFSFNTDGAKVDSVILDMGYRNPLTEASLQYKVDEDGNKRRQIDMYMDGASVFAQGFKIIPQMIQSLMDELETSPEEYDSIIAHQANALLLRKITKKAGFAPEQNVSIIADYGNSSSSCIPMILSKYGTQYHHPMLWAIGGGLSIGIADVDINNVNCLGIIEKDF